jgi:hypothetical protein
MNNPKTTSARKIRCQTSRRQTIKTITAGMAAAAFTPSQFSSRLWGASAPEPRLNIALLGCGGRGRQDLLEALRYRTNLIALCDVDQNNIAVAREDVATRFPHLKDTAQAVRGYTDYRELLAKETTLDAVIIAIGPWWHAPMSAAFIKAGKHVYCEKPLTHAISEARMLGELARNSKVATQMGTQGVASESFRRAIEVAQSGILGKVTEIHAWNVVHPLRPISRLRPAGEDPVPANLDWDMWQGPVASRPYKAKTYEPGCMVTAMWLEFGMGLIGDFGVHTWQLPISAFNLSHPLRVEHNIPEEVKETYVSNAKIRYDFPGGITGWYYDTINRPPARLMNEIIPTFGTFPTTGAVSVMENGLMFSGGWSAECYLKFKGDEKFRGIGKHPAVANIPKTEPRSPGIFMEWIEAALNGTKTYQGFERAARSMEIILPSLVSLRLQRAIEWDGINMKVPGSSEADQLIHKSYRKKYLL